MVQILVEHTRTQVALPPVGTPARVPDSTEFGGKSEADLLDLAVAGDRDAFYQLVQPHEKVVYAMAYSIVGDQPSAEEVAQEAMLKALRYIAGFRRESKFSTWLIQIVVNEARMLLRKERRGLYESLDEVAADDEFDSRPRREIADWREIPSALLETKELRAALEKAIFGLAPKYREVFTLRDIHHKSITETAAALCISEAAVKTRLLRARLQLQGALAQFHVGRTGQGGE